MIGNPIVSSHTFTLICFIISILLIILAVVAVIVYVHKNNELMKKTLKEQNNKTFESFRDTIQNINTGLADTVIDALRDSTHIPMTKAEEEKYNREELLNTFARIRDVIKDDLYSAMKSTNACRTALYLFHNGVKSTNGIHLLKVSCIGEKTLIGSGIQEQILNHSNMPINLFDNMFEKLTEHGKYIIINDDETMNSARGKFISAAKIRYAIATAIYDNSNRILGFILAEFDHNYTKNISDAEFNELKKLSDKIAPILSFSEYADLTLQNTGSNNIEEK